MSPHRDLDLEDSKTIVFLQNTLAHDKSSPYQILFILLKLKGSATGTGIIPLTLM